MKNSPRSASYQALLSEHQGKSTLSDSLAIWQKETNPISRDFHLAQEIAYGTKKREISLDYLSRQLVYPNPLKLKAKEKILLRMALYQALFLDRIPLYAIVNESVHLAKRFCHARFASFLNAALRKIEKISPSLPEGNSIEAMSTRLSYPIFFIEELLKEYTLDQVEALLQVMNAPPKLQARKRFTPNLEMTSFEGSQTEVFAKDTNYYIQNTTPAHLLSQLYTKEFAPKNILDLCAAPGGKLLQASELFPKAEIYANDISEKRLERLKNNIEKYNLNVRLSCFSGETFPEGQKFDLIILDVPCSNSGVLHKRPEARVRLNLKSLQDLKELQLALIEKAAKLLSPQGQIWYLTCSIMNIENEDLVKQASEKLNLKVANRVNQLPNANGCDGGFGCLLKK